MWDVYLQIKVKILILARLLLLSLQFPMIENDFSFSHNTIFVKAKLETQRGFQHWVPEDSNFAH